uniref:Tick transposon n=1 Tax=Rhipicephalus appendiculatus TaxID=34631 RepID=A0A131YLD7_RHIAP
MEVGSLLEQGLPLATTGFSIDIEYLFYSISHDGLLAAVGQKVQDSEEVAYHSAEGVSTENFLELVMFYLNSTTIEFIGKYYMQKAGICIGSSVAPILCDIYLSVFFQRVEQLISGQDVVKICR